MKTKRPVGRPRKTPMPEGTSPQSFWLVVDDIHAVVGGPSRINTLEEARKLAAKATEETKRSHHVVQRVATFKFAAVEE